MRSRAEIKNAAKRTLELKLKEAEGELGRQRILLKSIGGADDRVREGNGFR